MVESVTRTIMQRLSLTMTDWRRLGLKKGVVGKSAELVTTDTHYFLRLLLNKSLVNQLPMIVNTNRPAINAQL